MPWYKSLGQGMGETLIFANEQSAYTLADRGTYLSMSDKLPNLAVLVGGANLAENKDKALLNPYASDGGQSDLRTPASGSIWRCSSSIG
jgi:tungstate transport system substrate-binding protein